MNNPDTQFDLVEANLSRLCVRIPDLPATGLLLSRLILHLGRGMAGLLEREIRPCGLAEAEFRVLMTLFSQPDGAAFPSELCARTAQSAANMSRISDALVKRRFITRVLSDYDRRRMVLRITEQGEALVHGLLPTLFGPVRTMFEDFSDAEQQHLIAQLKRLGLKLDAAMAREVPVPSA